MEQYILISGTVFEEFLRIAPISDVQELVNKKNLLITQELSEQQKEINAIAVLDELPEALKPKDSK